MASKIDEQLFKAFAEISGGKAAGPERIDGSGDALPNPRTDIVDGAALVNPTAKNSEAATVAASAMDKTLGSPPDTAIGSSPSESSSGPGTGNGLSEIGALGGAIGPAAAQPPNKDDNGGAANIAAGIFDSISSGAADQPESGDTSDRESNKVDPIFNAASGSGGGQNSSGAETGPAPEVNGSTFDAASESGGGQSSGGASSYGQQNVSSGNNGGGGIGSTLESIASTVLEGGLGIVPLVSGLLGLFGGNSAPPPAPQKYSMPSPISFEAADTGNGLSDSDYDQMGMPRVYGDTSNPAASSGNAASNTNGSDNTSGAGTSSAAASGAGSGQQITVNVQAMDAQSFMGYSSQIAQAVRDAMLNSSSINDVINEL